MLRRGKQPVAAIFIHAGAGFHSIANEGVHLEACSEAARVGMMFLKNGASATEAVEAAIKCLEDQEITNAGFGSNLNIEGIVEGDATIVDHLGRSGACGACPGIKNPISLAKMILDHSCRPLSLRRVPPNILVGVGAKGFAEEHGMTPTLNDNLISRNAKERFLRWTEDLKKAESRLIPAPTACALDSASTAATLTGTWNEGQPDSPRPLRNASQGIPQNPLGLAAPVFQVPGSHTSAKRPKNLSDGPISRPTRRGEPSFDGQSHDGTAINDGGLPNAVGAQLPGEPVEASDPGQEFGNPDVYKETQKKDKVTDTVGAIAIDLKGRIAAGSSSGGIGMKHTGRIGPAALVGVGTAVIPEDAEDPDRTSVAAVTSGTGEHMATTLASSKCVERLFYGTRRGPGGRNIEEEDEQILLESFIMDDFMGHPGVKPSPTAGAIGVMAVKKDRRGIWFYFAHNTDSFALASMSTFDREPLCVMSRLGKDRRVSQGARKIRLD
ncbi:hypothetical protein V8F06_012324 [Rhypophila decipiens]